MYLPNCAFACRSTFSSAVLTCTDHDHEGGGHSHGAGPTSPECYASDEPWLTTLAYCIKSTCADYNVPAWQLEKYWADKCTNDQAVQPKWTYQQTVEELAKVPAPTKELGEEEMLNFTALYNAETWEGYRGTLSHFENAETRHSRYGIILVVIKPRLVYPAIFGTYYVRPLPFQLGNAPTMGQSLYIAMFIILNIVLTAVGYKTYQPNMWFADSWQEVMGYLSARTGVLAFALAPLVILLSGRNNVLLWLTNWSHSTYMLLHRWVARLFAIQVILHSITEFELYRRMGEVAVAQKEHYWIWGIVATLATCIMIVVSTLFFRRLSYEIFLIVHVVMAVFVLAGSWYHVEILFTRKWGYEVWIYAACAVWFFDRLIRVGRILKNGRRRAEITQVTEDIVRVDVKGIRWSAEPGKHTYAYFPTLNPLRPWENHPFSIVPTALLVSKGHSVGASASSTGSQHSGEDVEKSGTKASVSAAVRATISSTSGISLYVRKSKGLTKALVSNASLLTLLDGPYPNNSTSAVLKTDRLILIAGGIGITAILPFIAHHSNVRLSWSMKAASEGLATDLQGVLGGLREKDVKIGSRHDVAALLAEEAAVGWKRIGVVVCGPGSLCDDVRSLVAQKGREGGAVWELDVEAFSW
ncbi:ferric reductase transmembrane component 4 [Amniculicola lignicola CBS 123094]|uniref:Ferric reductase transmembrane component 4 n=1 Tax=Amniculicola lignicola CBS 123094 TaxID=1392246 RepID=A0A6A5WIR2_9PLEO|nr:ferric reductase transmembrane component 4 [Amniculicola lignicola CBS 123094]